MELIELMAKRRSVRKYTGEDIPEEKLEKVLQAALLAPTSMNKRPWEFYLVKDPMKLLTLDNEFHEIIYRICNKMQCHYMVSLMSMHFDRVRSLSLHSVKDLKIVSDHRAIFEAIKKKDPAAARAAFQKHMARFELDWNIISREYKKYIAEPSH